jgi:hypothetical protein
MRVEGLGQGSERMVLDISVDVIDAVWRFTEVLKEPGLTAVRLAVIMRTDDKESGARPHQELIWEIPA